MKKASARIIIREHDVTAGSELMETYFLDLSDADVAKLRAADPAVKVIQEKQSNISFDWLRETFKGDNGLKDKLKYGTAVLSDTDQLDQYLYTYGKMISAQWDHVLKGYILNDNPVRIIDYGCGQGLAGLLHYDRFGGKLVAKVGEIFLIEPSAAALVRAEAVYRKLFPEATIYCLNVTSTSIDKKYFRETNSTTIHLFSNVLDIPSFSQSHVFNATLTTGQHQVLAVSHNRTFAGGAKKIVAIKEELEKKKYKDWIDVKSSRIEEFTCGEDGKFPAISWLARLEINRG